MFMRTVWMTERYINVSCEVITHTKLLKTLIPSLMERKKKRGFDTQGRPTELRRIVETNYLLVKQ
jgi:hypothetical protein